MNERVSWSTKKVIIQRAYNSSLLTELTESLLNPNGDSILIAVFITIRHFRLSST
jgi:hypothetical protein